MLASASGGRGEPDLEADVIRDNQRLLYKRQNTSTESVTCCSGPLQRHYGCRIGMVQVLHTYDLRWAGQQLGLHVHIHVVMTAGGWCCRSAVLCRLSTESLAVAGLKATGDCRSTTAAGSQATGDCRSTTGG